MIATATWDEMARLVSEPQKKPNPDPCDVEILLIGEYLVSGSTKPYQVHFGVRGKGDLFAACTCQGSLHGRCCRHIKAAWPIHVVLTDLEVDIAF